MTSPVVVRPILLLAHQGSDELDRLTVLFEGLGWEVKTAGTLFQATSHLEGETPISVVAAQWDPHVELGLDVFNWVLRQRPALRGKFVFLAAVAPDTFDAVVEGRALILDPENQGELIRVVNAASQQLDRAQDDSNSEWLDSERPTLLLVDDDPVLLMVIAAFLGDSGFAVTTAESSSAAMAEMRISEFDVVLADWQMDNGAGGDLLRWITEQRIAMLGRLAFLSSTAAGESQAEAKGCRAFNKGQDSRALIDALKAIARGESAVS